MVDSNPRRLKLVERMRAQGVRVTAPRRAIAQVLESADEKTVKTHNTLGNVWVNMQKISRKRSFEMSSPTAVAAIRGTVFQMQTESDSSTQVRVFDGKVDVGPSAALKKRLDADKPEETPPQPGDPNEVPGPQEIPGPYEVSLEQWHAIVAGQMISVRSDGKFASEDFDVDEAADDAFVKKNLELDEKLRAEDDGEE